MAFEEIYNNHKKLVYNLALHYVNNTEDAEEITQDVFVKIYEKIPHFNHQSSIKTWIYRITINQSLDFIKAKQRKKNWFLFSNLRTDEAKQSLNVADISHPGIDLEQKEAVEKILKSITLLKEEQKTVLILLKIEGLSQAETSEIMKISTKAVESLFQRAKSNLKQILTQNEGI
jgi:RNA polymerase sigma-70 factor (ECF subfamily)